MYGMEWNAKRYKKQQKNIIQLMMCYVRLRIQQKKKKTAS